VAETGGGKTLAYLLPIIDTCKDVRKTFPHRSKNQPIAIVVVPTRELAFQVYSTLQRLLSNQQQINAAIDLNPECINAKRSVTSTEINSLEDLNANDKLVDVLVTTPIQLEKRLKSRESEAALNSVYLKHIVMDEADTLMDDSFNQITLNCLSLLELNLNLPLTTDTGLLFFYSCCLFFKSFTRVNLFVRRVGANDSKA